MDLITALFAPNTKLAEQPTLESIDTPEADTEVFTVLMQGTPVAQNPERPTLEWPVHMPMAVPQEEIGDPSAKIKDPEDNASAPPPDIKDFAAPPTEINAMVPRPDVTPPEVVASYNPAIQEVGTIVRPSAKISVPPQIQAPTGPATVATSIALPADAPVQVKLESKQTAAAAPATPLLINPTKLSPLPEVEGKRAHTEPTMRVASLPASQTTHKSPPLPGQFANLEHVIEDPAEVQFSIKIERQSIEHVQASRAPAPPAPVANQISTQLPQLLTKAEKQTVELRLDPPELGRVTIHLITHDQQVTAQVVAERVQTVDLMRQHADLLTATLARAGFSEANLSFQQGQGGEQGPEQFQSFAGASESDTPTTPVVMQTGQDGRLDIRL